MATLSDLYESNQNQNGVARFIHSKRHLIAADIVRRISSHGRKVEVLDIGCATGKTFGFMNDAANINYCGLDYSPDFISTASRRYAEHGNARFEQFDATDTVSLARKSADLVIALETLEHIPENDVVRVVETVCRDISPEYFLVSVPVEIGPAILAKNIGSRLMGYDRLEYSLRDTLNSSFYRLNRVPKHGVSHRGFNWFWLEQTVRHNAKTMETISLPFPWLPASLSSNVMFVASCR